MMDDFDANVWSDGPSSPPPRLSASSIASTEPKAPQPRPLSSTVPLDFSNFENDGNDDGDDAFGSAFHEAPQTHTLATVQEGGGDGGFDDDDEFGDFGDFGDAAVAEPFDDDDADGQMDDFRDAGFEDAGAFQLPPEPGPSNWTPLRLNPLPSRPELIRDVETLLEPAFGVRPGHDDGAGMTSDPIRQVEGLGQILVTSSRCDQPTANFL